MTIYTADGCNPCKEMLSFLRQRGVPHKEIRLNRLSNRELSKTMPKILVDNKLATPITVIDGEKLVGVDGSIKKRILCKTVDRSACDA